MTSMVDDHTVPTSSNARMLFSDAETATARVKFVKSGQPDQSGQYIADGMDTYYMPAKPHDASQAISYSEVEQYLPKLIRSCRNAKLATLGSAGAAGLAGLAGSACHACDWENDTAKLKCDIANQHVCGKPGCNQRGPISCQSVRRLPTGSTGSTDSTGSTGSTGPDSCQSGLTGSSGSTGSTGSDLDSILAKYYAQKTLVSKPSKPSGQTGRTDQTGDQSMIDHLARLDQLAPKLAPFVGQHKSVIVPSMKLDPPGLADLAPGARLGCKFVSEQTKTDLKSIDLMTSQIAELTASRDKLEASYASSQATLAQLDQAAKQCCAKRKFSQLVADQVALVARCAKHALSTCVLDQTSTDQPDQTDSTNSTNSTNPILQQLEHSQLLDSQAAQRGVLALEQVVSVLSTC